MKSFLECVDYKKLNTIEQTIFPFVIGEPSVVKRITFCHHNKENIGIASEMEFPHVAVIKLQPLLDARSDYYRTESKCVGSLISERHVLTSTFCVNSDHNYKLEVQLGAFNYDLAGRHVKSFDVEKVESIYGVSILKLDRKIEFSEHIIPICLFPDKNVTSQYLLAGWTGDWRECDPRLKKWHIENNGVDVKHSLLSIDESAIINYRQVIRKFFGKFSCLISFDSRLCFLEVHCKSITLTGLANIHWSACTSN